MAQAAWVVWAEKVHSASLSLKSLHIYDIAIYSLFDFPKRDKLRKAFFIAKI